MFAKSLCLYEIKFDISSHFQYAPFHGLHMRLVRVNGFPRTR